MKALILGEQEVNNFDSFDIDEVAKEMAEEVCFNFLRAKTLPDQFRSVSVVQAVRSRLLGLVIKQSCFSGRFSRYSLANFPWPAFLLFFSF